MICISVAEHICALTLILHGVNSALLIAGYQATYHDNAILTLRAGTAVNFTAKSLLDCVRECQQNNCLTVIYNEGQCQQHPGLTTSQIKELQNVTAGEVALVNHLQAITSQAETTSTSTTSTSTTPTSTSTTETSTSTSTTETSTSTTTTMPTLSAGYAVVNIDGARWRAFWWYENMTEWPSSEDDVLKEQYGNCDVTLSYCFGRLPAELEFTGAEMLAKDSDGTIYRWSFESTNIVSQAVWGAFHDHTQVASSEVRNTGDWRPQVISGTVMSRNIDSFMYRVQSGVASVLLDDDNCACWSVLSMGHGMCFSSSSGSTYGVDSLYDPSCTKPSPTRGLTLYFRDDGDCHPPSGYNCYV